MINFSCCLTVDPSQYLKIMKQYLLMRSAQQKRGSQQKQVQLLPIATSGKGLNLLTIVPESLVAEVRLFEGFAHLKVFQSSMPESKFLHPYSTAALLETKGVHATDRNVNLFENQPANLGANWALVGEAEKSDHSLIDDLLQLQDETNALFRQHQHKASLQQLQAVQTKSFQQQDSYNFQENQSELAQLTLEEKEFFNNFTCSRQPRDTNQISIFTGIDLLTSHKQRDDRTVCRVMQEKRRIIRNFFRPKDSIIKDQKTCCNSGTFLEELVLQSNKSLKKTSFEDQLQGVEERVCAL